MEDLDLDELDQAVTKMMDKPKGKRAAKRPVTTQPAAARPLGSLVVTPSVPPSKEHVATPEPRKPEPTRVAVNRPVRVPERKRMHPGAMDIIQPVMPPKPPAPSVRASREAPAITPVTKEVTPEPVPPVVTPPQPEPVVPPQPRPVTSSLLAPFPTEETPAPTPRGGEVSDELLASLRMSDEPAPASLPKNKPLDPERASANGWPDPLDFHDFSGQPAQDAPKEAPPTMHAEPVSVTDEHPDAATGSSPFVTTKVEKRPLGAYADATPEPPKAVLPETDNQVPHESTSKGDMAEASLESKQHLTTDDAEQDMDSLRQMAIPQQYHTAPQHPKEDVHNVFDTKEYHAAPQHMYPPRKSGVGLVIGVVVLIVLIVASVLVGYLMMTGTFDPTQLW